MTDAPSPDLLAILLTPHTLIGTPASLPGRALGQQCSCGAQVTAAPWQTLRKQFVKHQADALAGRNPLPARPPAPAAEPVVPPAPVRERAPNQDLYDQLDAMQRVTR